jgi:hypothetical protein
MQYTLYDYLPSGNGVDDARRRTTAARTHYRCLNKS